MSVLLSTYTETFDWSELQQRARVRCAFSLQPDGKGPLSETEISSRTLFFNIFLYFPFSHTFWTVHDAIQLGLEQLAHHSALSMSQ